MVVDAHIFPSKLLLFGEQTVLIGSKALSIPFAKYSGCWAYANEKCQSLTVLVDQLPNDILTIDAFKQAVEEGLHFDSTIPQRAGLGSSGALSAGLYHQFARNQKKTVADIQSDLAAIESVFHGKSSGTDALVSYTNQVVYTNDDRTTLKELNVDQKSIFISLLDSKQDRQAKTYIELFLKKVEANEIDHTRLCQSSDLAIDNFLEDNTGTFYESMEQLSSIQLQEFKDFIPDHLTSLWTEGLSTQKWLMKLCGAGGGGYFLLFSKEKPSIADVIPVNWE